MQTLVILGFGIVGISVRVLINNIYFGSTLGSSIFPWNTFLINMIGSSLIGFTWIYFSTQSNSAFDWLKLPLLVGLLGGFTTFSAYSLEVVQLFENSRFIEGLLYATLSPIWGAVICGLSILLGRSFLT